MKRKLVFNQPVVIASSDERQYPCSHKGPYIVAGDREKPAENKPKFHVATRQRAEAPRRAACNFRKSSPLAIHIQLRVSANAIARYKSWLWVAAWLRLPYVRLVRRNGLFFSPRAVRVCVYSVHARRKYVAYIVRKNCCAKPGCFHRNFGLLALKG